MPGKYAKVNTPTTGKAEVKGAMLKVRAHSGRSVTTAAIARRLGPRVPVADVTTVLAALVSDGDVTSGSGSHTLTAAGLDSVRHHPHSRYTPV